MIKFGILGLGRVVKSRIFDVFKKEVKKASVIAVYDKDKRKNFKFSKYFNTKKNLIMYTLQQSQEVMLKV